MRYPLGAVYQHGYDEMGRPKTMIDAGTQTTVIGSATYGPAGELLTMGNETRQYNSRLQVTRITYPTQDWEYKYSATQNNGQITAMKDWTSGEEVNYAYDELKRLASAVTVGPEWGNSYVYDGFGNLLQKNVVKGSAPYMNLSIDPATNKPYSGYSAAGLPTVGAQFDNDNRMISTTAGSSYTEYYAYSPAGKRVWNRGKRDIGGTWVDQEEVWFWGVTGQRMAFYSLTASGNPVFTLTSTNLYMGSKLVAQGAGASVTAVKLSRIKSAQSHYPWGEERTPTGASGEKFATYYHDVQAAMNYADQRWYGTNGRFQVPDPSRRSIAIDRPESWNRYSYSEGDPVNRLDWRGLRTCFYVDGELDSCEEDPDPPQDPDPERDPFAPPSRPVDSTYLWRTAAEATTLTHRLTLSNALNQLPQDCWDAFQNKLGISRDRAEELAQELRFYNGVGPEAALTIGDLVTANIGLDASQLAQTVGSVAAEGAGYGAVSYGVTDLATGKVTVTNIVILTATFNAQLANGQGLNLVHELLHFAAQKNDTGLADTLNLAYQKTGKPEDIQAAASTAIKDWLGGKCK